MVITKNRDGSRTITIKHIREKIVIVGLLLVVLSVIKVIRK